MITENQLDVWVRGNSRQAQGVIPELVARLTATSVPRPTERRFPLADSIGQPGPDGKLDCEKGFPPYVSSGMSYWEIGTGDDLPGKATSDYNGLTSEVGTALPAEERARSEFVFVTPLSAVRGWTVDKQKRWVTARERKKEWRGVRVIDGTRLVAWMAEWPSVERWLAKLMGLHGDQLESPDTRWRLLRSIGQPPPLSPGVFLADRNDACEKLQGVLDRTYQRLKVITRHPEQLADFVAAYLARMDEDPRLEAEGRCLIIGGPEAWSEVADQGQPHLLVADGALDLSGDGGTKLIQKALLAGHAIVFWGPPGGLRDPVSVPLAFPREDQLKDALIESGYPGERARALAQRSAGNLGSLLRVLQNLSSLPEWAQGSVASELFIAELLGSWTDGSQGDQTVAGELAGKAYGGWIEVMRNLALIPGTPLLQRDGHWTLQTRYEGWYALGPRGFDAHLDRFRSVAIVVLGERDPQFDLLPEERFAARVRGKDLAHSPELAHGLAETVALLGTHPDALKSCSPGNAEATAALIVRAVTSDADWSQWASMNDFLPLLAEGAPDEFLDAVEAALDRNPCPFEELFAQEGKGALGSNYMTGTLWALETLAWDTNLLSRVLLCLAGLAAIDPGGRWSNRPLNSMTTILLPWLPQTCAPAATRQSAVEAVLREHPEIGWKLLISVLPRRHMVSGYTRKPAWRETVPDDWTDGVSRAAYWADVDAYVDLLLFTAGADADRLAELVETLDDLPPNGRDRLLTRLSSSEVRQLPEIARLGLWNRLASLVANHRAYADAEWALPREEVDKIATVAEGLAPTQPIFVHRRLFTERAMDLFEEKGNWEEQRTVLANRQSDAVREISETGGPPAVASFATTVDSPWRVGWSYGLMGSPEADSVILPGMLQTDDRRTLEFAGGYVGGRSHGSVSDWAQGMDVTQWSAAVIGQFLAFLQFEPTTWELVESRLGESRCEYWSRANVNPLSVPPQRGARASR